MSAFVPDLPECITTGKTVEEIAHNIREAIELHLEGMAEDARAHPGTKHSRPRDRSSVCGPTRSSTPSPRPLAPDPLTTRRISSFSDPRSSAFIGGHHCFCSPAVWSWR